MRVAIAVPIAASIRNRLLVLGLVLTCVCGLVGGPAHAQAPSLDRFSVIRFAPAEGPGNILTTDAAQTPGHILPAFGLMVDYAHAPLSLFNATCVDLTNADCEVTTENTRLVRYTLSTHVWGTLSLWNRIQIGLLVPIAHATRGTFAYTLEEGGQLIELVGGNDTAVGDPRVSVKANFVDNPEGFGLGGKLFMGIPLGQEFSEDGFLGDDGVSFGGKLLAGYTHDDFRLVGNLGGLYRPTQQLFSTELGSELTYAAAFEYQATPLVVAQAEVEGATSFSGDSDENRMEGRLSGSSTSRTSSSISVAARESWTDQACRSFACSQAFATCP